MLNNFLDAADAVSAVEYGFNDERPKGLLYSEYRVLKCLASNETLKVVSERRNITQQAAGKALAKLVTKGLALQNRHPKSMKNKDRRESVISITTKGETALLIADATLITIIKQVENG